MKTALVNGQEISQDAIQFELDRLVRFYVSHGMSVAEVKPHLPELTEKALDQAIGAKLLFERATQLDLPVSAEDVDAEVARVIEQVGGEENYRKALEAQGLAEADFRKELEKGARVNKLVNQACASVPEPSEADVAAFYETHRDEYVVPEEVLCQHILVKCESGATPEAQNAALDKIKAIRERIVSDKSDFAEEAKQHSDCPSGQQGGSLGWFGRGMMVPEFDKAAFEMKKGEVSGVILTQFGYHIIYKADQRGGEKQTLVDVHDQIKDLIRHDARGQAMDAFVAELREKATIEYRDAHDHACSCGCHHG